MNEQVKQVWEYFQENYPHIYFDMSNDQIQKFMGQKYLQNLPFERVVDCLQDYILASGCECDE